MFKGLTDVLLADLPSGMAGPFVVGVLASLGSGLLAIVGLLDYVRRHSYDAFVIYRLIAAAVILLLIATGARAASSERIDKRGERAAGEEDARPGRFLFYLT